MTFLKPAAYAAGVDPRLIILGLVKRAPMHGYELMRAMKRTRADRWSGVLKGSVYHALKALTAEGLLKLRPVDPQGGRVKAVYEITTRGRAELKQLLRNAWRTTARGLPASLFGAVAFLDELPADEVLALLQRQQVSLTSDLATWREDERSSAPLPPHVRLILEAAAQHLEADLRLTQNLKLLLGAYGPVAGRK